MPGLVEVRRKALISYFGSLRTACRKRRGDCRGTGFGPKTALAIKEALQQAPQRKRRHGHGEVLDSVWAPPVA